MFEVLRREAVYLGYYFSLQLEQIFGYWVLGMVLGSAISVFAKDHIHGLFRSMGGKQLGVLGIFAASALGVASPLCMYGAIPLAASFSESGMPLPKESRYTYADFLAGTEEDREELIEGHFRMISGPSRAHQEAVGEIYAQLHNHLRGKKCKACIAPFDVRLFERDGDQPDDVDTVVEPDVMVVCDASKVDERGIKGAPDLIVEVLSHPRRAMTG